MIPPNLTAGTKRASYRANTKGLPTWVASFVLATWFKVVATAAVIA